jgi:hypothetical protein
MSGLETTYDLLGEFDQAIAECHAAKERSHEAEHQRIEAAGA